MKKALILTFSLLISKVILAQNEIGPDGDKLIGLIIVLTLLGVVAYFVLNKMGKKNRSFSFTSIFKFRRINIELEKDRLYYPDFLTLTVKNTGNTDLDLERPLMIFFNFWFKRKFRIKGMENYTFYPLYLEKGKTHTLEIDINRFYSHDKKLKRFPKVKIVIYEVKGKRLGSKTIYLRKTLFR